MTQKEVYPALIKMELFPVEVLERIARYVGHKTLFHFLCVCKNAFTPKLSRFCFRNLRLGQILSFRSSKDIIKELEFHLSTLGDFLPYFDTPLQNVQNLLFINDRLVIGRKEDYVHINTSCLTSRKSIGRISFTGISEYLFGINKKGIVLNIEGKHIEELAFFTGFFSCIFLVNAETIVKELYVEGGTQLGLRTDGPAKEGTRLKVFSIVKNDENMPEELKYRTFNLRDGLVRIDYCILSNREDNFLYHDYMAVDKTAFLIRNSEIHKLQVLLDIVDKDYLETIRFEGAVVRRLDNTIDLRGFNNIKYIELKLCCVEDSQELANTDDFLYDFFEITLTFSENDQINLTLTKELQDSTEE